MELFFKILLNGVEVGYGVVHLRLRLESRLVSTYIPCTAKNIGTYHQHDLVAYEVGAAFLPPCNEREKANFPLVSASSSPGTIDLQILGTDILIHFSKYGRSLQKRNIDPCLQEAIDKAAACGIDEEPIRTGLFYFSGNVNLVLRLSRRLT